MAKKKKQKLERIFRESTPAEIKRHNKIIKEVKKTLGGRIRKPNPTRVALVKLKAQRMLQGLSLADMEERTGMARANISKLENHAENAKLSTLQAYANALGLELVIGVQTRKKTRAKS